jgi:hypothetical protein
MPKSMTKQQVNALDAAVSKLDKKGVKGKDLEAQIKGIMKSLGIKESNLDELSMSLKDLSKTGIPRAVTKDKPKIKKGLKDLRKRLDKYNVKKEDDQKPIIVRSRKSVGQLHRTSRSDNKVVRQEAKGPCWDTHKQVGTKVSSRTGKTVPNCVPKSEDLSTSKKSGNFLSTKDGAGMTKKGVAAYRRKNPGSKLKTAVTGKVKPGSKDAGRRKSFCARSQGWTGERGKAARARWKC